MGALLPAGTCAAFTPRLLGILRHLLQEALLGHAHPALRHCLIYNSLKPNLLLPQLPGTSRQAKVSAGPARSGVVQPHRCPLPLGSACPMACPGTSYASACLRSLHELFPLPETCFLHPTNTCFSSEFQLCVTSPRGLLHSHQANVSTGSYS